MAITSDSGLLLQTE